jgi:alpha-mannosidase
MRFLVIYIFLLACTSCRAARLGPYDTSATREDDATAAGTSNRLQIHIVPHSHDDAGWLKTVDQYYYGLRQDIQPAGVQYTLDTIVMSLLANPHRRFTFAEMAFFERWWNQQDEDTQSLVRKFVKDGRLNFVNGGYVQHDEAAAHYIAMVDQTTRGHRFLKKEFNIAPTIGWQVDPFGHSSIQAGLLGPALGFDALFFGRADYQDMKKRSEDKELEHLWRGSGSGPSSSSSASKSSSSSSFTAQKHQHENNINAESTLFTGNFPSGNYGPPPGFWWEWTSSPDPIIADDPDLEEYNVEERVNTFVERCFELANVTRGNDIMLTMGSDFHYSNAHVWYKNLDKLIHYVNKDGRVNVFYSSPEDYVAAKYSYNATWPVKYDDFFPYADTPHSYWTGYFSSRAASKGYIRLATAYLQAARQLEAYVGRGGGGKGEEHSTLFDGNDGKNSTTGTVNSSTATTFFKLKSTTETLEEAVSLCQHHDSITGTAKQHVANDYHSRIYHGMEEAQNVVMHALGHLIAGGGRSNSGSGGEIGAGAGVGVVATRKLQMKSSSSSFSEGEDAFLHLSHMDDDAATNHQITDKNDYSPVRLEGCFLLNISTCAPTIDLSRVGAPIFLVAYNPLAWSRETPIRVPISTYSTCNWTVTGPEGQEIPSQLVPISESTQSVQSMLASVNATDPVAAGDAEIVFLGELPPLGYSSYILEPVGGEEQRKNEKVAVAAAVSSKKTVAEEDDTVSISNGLITVTFDQSSGLMSSISLGSSSNKNNSGAHRNGGTSSVSSDFTTIQLSSTLRWHNASDGLDSDEDRGQSSGAYIFRPSRGSSDYPISREIPSAGGKEENQPSLVCTGSSFLSRFFSLRRGLWRSCQRRRTKQASPAVATLQVIKGEEVSEVWQVFDDWATLITRVYKGQKYVEVEWTVGPIPFEDGLGREIILKYSSNVQNSKGSFFTDANGRAMIERKFNTRATWDLNVTEEIAGNYYPITAAAYIQDENMQFAVLTDRAQGGASLNQGEMEFMVHRRNLVDDRRGVREPMNETMCGCIECDCPGLVVRGTHWLVLSDSVDSAAVSRRQLQQMMNDPPVLAFGHVPQSPGNKQGETGEAKESTTRTTDNSSFFELRRSFSLTNDHILHKGAHLMTLMRTSARTLLVRVAHILDQGEEEVDDSEEERGSLAGDGVGCSLTENLGALLAQFHCSGRPEELTLSGNQLKRDSDKRRLKFKPGRSMSLKEQTVADKEEEEAEEEEEEEKASLFAVDGRENKDEGEVKGDEGSWLVHLKPMEVRTYEIDC